jgi:hypothetical protein
MSNEIGKAELLLLAKQPNSILHATYSRVGSGMLLMGRAYRAVINKTGEEKVLAGAELLQFIYETCKTLTHWTVLARMSFFPA